MFYHPPAGLRNQPQRLRRQTSDRFLMFPGQQTSGRFTLTSEDDSQTGFDAFHTAGDNPIMPSIPDKDRAPGAQILSAVEPRWGHGLRSLWEGLVPLAWMPPRVVNPQLVSGWNPLVQHPNISRGHPVPWGSRIPVLGEGQ